LEKRDIEVEVGTDIYGNPTATLRLDEDTVLVRSNKKGMVTRLIPTAQDIGTVIILSRVGGATSAAFDAMAEDAGDFLTYEDPR
jgi:hypothetical protein